MKEGRRLGGVHAGPESKVLDGLSWEEVKNMQDAQTSQVDGYGSMKIGAASKGIIQRDFQHHATVFKSPYAKNPFDSVSNDELEEYKRIIDKKQRGETSPIAEDPGDTTDPGKQDPAHHRVPCYWLVFSFLDCTNTNTALCSTVTEKGFPAP